MSKTKKAPAKATKKATSKAAKATKPASVGAQSANGAPKGAKAGKPTTARAGSRKEAIVALISRKDGATLPEIMKATGWQAHSVRGMIATLGKTLKIESSKSEAGERTYLHQA